MGLHQLPEILVAIIIQPGFETHREVIDGRAHFQRQQAVFVVLFGAVKMKFDTTPYYRWCPSSLAKLVNITPISLWFMADITN